MKKPDPPYRQFLHAGDDNPDLGQARAARVTNTAAFRAWLNRRMQDAMDAAEAARLARDYRRLVDITGQAHRYAVAVMALDEYEGRA